MMKFLSQNKLSKNVDIFGDFCILQNGLLFFKYLALQLESNHFFPSWLSYKTYFPWSIWVEIIFSLLAMCYGYLILSVNHILEHISWCPHKLLSKGANLIYGL